MKKILFIASFLSITLITGLAVAQNAATKSNANLKEKQTNQAARHTSAPRSEAGKQRVAESLKHQQKAGVTAASQKQRHNEQVAGYSTYKQNQAKASK